MWRKQPRPKYKDFVHFRNLLELGFLEMILLFILSCLKDDKLKEQNSACFVEHHINRKIDFWTYFDCTQQQRS